LFLSPLVFNIFFFTVSVILLSLLFISIRVTFCRFRYDKLITFAWKSLLPCSLLLLLLSLILLFR
jgi:NADH-quinone oxidoreductase subunit H